MADNQSSQNTQISSPEINPDVTQQQTQPDMGACASAIGASKSPKTVSPATSQNPLPSQPESKELSMNATGVNKGADALSPTDTSQAPSKPDVVPDGPVEQCNSTDAQSTPPPAQLSITQTDSKHFKEAATTPTHPAEKSLQNAMKDFEQTAEDLAAEVSKTKAVLQQQAQTTDEQSPKQNDEKSNNDEKNASTTAEAIAEAITNEILQEVSEEVEKVETENADTSNSKIESPCDEGNPEVTSNNVEDMLEEEEAKPTSPTIKVQGASPAPETADSLESQNVSKDTNATDSDVPGDVSGKSASEDNEELADVTDSSTEENVGPSAEHIKESDQSTAEETDQIEQVEVIEQSSVAEEVSTHQNINHNDQVSEETDITGNEATTETESVNQRSTEIKTTDSVVSEVVEKNTCGEKAPEEPSTNDLPETGVKNGLTTHEMYNYLLKLQREMSAMQLNMTRLQENMRSTSKVLQIVIESTEKDLGL